MRRDFYTIPALGDVEVVMKGGASGDYANVSLVNGDQTSFDVPAKWLVAVEPPPPSELALTNPEHLGLGEIIALLEAQNLDRILPLGFTNPHSWRGDYCDLAFEPAYDITVHETLTAARSALGTTYQGWKGGNYLMTASSDCWLARVGSGGGETIGALFMHLLLTEAGGGQA